MKDERPESWQKQDRDRAPCTHCGTPLRDLSYGNGGWAPHEIESGRSHADRQCIEVLCERLKDHEEQIDTIVLQREEIARLGERLNAAEEKLAAKTDGEE